MSRICNPSQPPDRTSYHKISKMQMVPTGHHVSTYSSVFVPFTRSPYKRCTNQRVLLTASRAPVNSERTPCNELPTRIDDVDEIAGDWVPFHTRNGPSVDKGVPIPGVNKQQKQQKVSQQHTSAQGRVPRPTLWFLRECSHSVLLCQRVNILSVPIHTCAYSCLIVPLSPAASYSSTQMHMVLIYL